MAMGTVKWFNNAKGFGFILPDDGGSDLFAHYSAIEMDGYKTLKAGQKVNFEVLMTDKGGHAKNINVIGTSEHENVHQHVETANDYAHHDQVAVG